MSEGTDSARGANPPTRESLALDRGAQLAKRGILLGVALTAVGVVMIVVHVVVVVGIVGVIVGPAFAWSGARGLRLLPDARGALATPPLALRLKVDKRRGYAAIPYSSVSLWPFEDDSSGAAVAVFGWQWSTPRIFNADRLPAEIYGEPAKGSVVVASCESGIVVGRIKHSRFADHGIEPARRAPALIRWLTRPRTLS